MGFWDESLLFRAEDIPVDGELSNALAAPPPHPQSAARNNLNSVEMLQMAKQTQQEYS